MKVEGGKSTRGGKDALHTPLHIMMTSVYSMPGQQFETVSYAVWEIWCKDGFLAFYCNFCTKKQLTLTTKMHVTQITFVSCILI